MDGYDIVANYFKEWIKKQSFIDRFYVACFRAKRTNYMTEPFQNFCELFEYDFDGDGDILWQIDWCEGENNISDLRFYSLHDIQNIIIDAEKHELSSTRKTKWFNVWR